MAEGRWITVNGTHIFIKNGQSVGDAISEHAAIANGKHIMSGTFGELGKLSFFSNANGKYFASSYSSSHTVNYDTLKRDKNGNIITADTINDLKSRLNSFKKPERDVIADYKSSAISKKDANSTVKAITGYNADKVKATLKDKTLTLSGTLETGKGYSSHSKTYDEKYHVSSKGELLINGGKYYNHSRGTYMTNWTYTGKYLPSTLRSKVSDVEIKFTQELD